MHLPSTQILWAEQALTAEGWQRDVKITIGDNGRIAALEGERPCEGVRLGLALPAPANVHSHAFQRALAGLTEYRESGHRDSFWTWRRRMYRFLDEITPDDLEAIAALAQMEMLEAGFAAVGEFHYLHHAPGGVPYGDPAEMSRRIMAAREGSGIGLALLPVLYAQGGGDGRGLEGGQRRFGHDLDGFADLLDRLDAAFAGAEPDCVRGMAPHSLRAVPRAMLDHLPELAPRGPVHIHIAEQQAEIADVQAHLGARPVEWILNILDVDARWCLVHATHMSPAETEGLAQSGAVAGLCPITEANLGDGIFDGARYLGGGGRLALGSDSLLRITLAGEVRALEYSQRLRHEARAVMAIGDKSVGRTILEMAARGGAQALGRGAGVLAVGEWADILGVDTAHRDLAGLTADRLLDSFLFVRSEGRISDVWSAGRHLVREGRHVRRGAILDKAAGPLARLRALS